MSKCELTSSQGITIGCMIAIAISWSLHKSIFWAMLHGICGWFYVIYYAIWVR